jgi:hypothetical protein
MRRYTQSHTQKSSQMNLAYRIKRLIIVVMGVCLAVLQGHALPPAFKSITTATTGDNNLQSLAIDTPPGAVAGDLLLAIIATDANEEISAALQADWTRMLLDTNGVACAATALRRPRPLWRRRLARVSSCASLRPMISGAWSIRAEIYLGTKDSSGADGMAFVLHHDPRGTAAVGNGEGSTLGTMANGLSIEFDTYRSVAGSDDTNEDHKVRHVSIMAPLDSDLDTIQIISISTATTTVSRTI